MTGYSLPWESYAKSYRAEDHYVINHKTNLNIITPIRLKDGSEQAIMYNKAPLRSSKGHVMGVIGYANLQTGYGMLQSLLMFSQRDQVFTSRNGNAKFSYQRVDNNMVCDLSHREFECLFFLIRGKTAQSIIYSNQSCK